MSFLSAYTTFASRNNFKKTVLPLFATQVFCERLIHVGNESLCCGIRIHVNIELTSIHSDDRLKWMISRGSVPVLGLSHGILCHWTLQGMPHLFDHQGILDDSIGGILGTPYIRRLKWYLMFGDPFVRLCCRSSRHERKRGEE